MENGKFYLLTSEHITSIQIIFSYRQCKASRRLLTTIKLCSFLRVNLCSFRKQIKKTMILSPVTPYADTDGEVILT